MKILVTGAAGFVGMHTSLRMLERGDQVVGIDNLNDYYDPALKASRLERLGAQPGFRFERIDVADRATLEALFAAEGFDRVVHLAAQTGVCYSITHPHAYGDRKSVV
jgi:UDP-glucuronate 4-epimerase